MSASLNYSVKSPEELTPEKLLSAEKESNFEEIKSPKESDEEVLLSLQQRPS